MGFFDKGGGFIVGWMDVGFWKSKNWRDGVLKNWVVGGGGIMVRGCWRGGVKGSGGS